VRIVATAPRQDRRSELLKHKDLFAGGVVQQHRNGVTALEHQPLLAAHRAVVGFMRNVDLVDFEEAADLRLMP
jgi:hypothetical protein